ncbi:hypothetical protein FA15DRAFT_578233, partial [Coprinopsis marcescibilis]
AAFTMTVQQSGDFIQQNGEGRYCYYPRAITATSVQADCVGTRAELSSVMQVQLRTTTTSINYFNAGLDRLGGPEWPVDDTAGKIYLCATGRGGDGSYQTICSVIRRDNDISDSPACKVEASQAVVNDGCYTPGLPPPESGGTESGPASGGPA